MCTQVQYIGTLLCSIPNKLKHSFAVSGILVPEECEDWIQEAQSAMELRDLRLGSHNHGMALDCTRAKSPSDLSVGPFRCSEGLLRWIVERFYTCRRPYRQGPPSM